MNILDFLHQMEDTLWQGLTDMLAKLPMGITAENLAEKYNITREQCDEFAILSQQRWGAGTVSRASHRLQGKKYTNQ